MENLLWPREHLNIKSAWNPSLVTYEVVKYLLISNNGSNNNTPPIPCLVVFFSYKKRVQQFGNWAIAIGILLLGTMVDHRRRCGVHATLVFQGQDADYFTALPSSPEYPVKRQRGKVLKFCIEKYVSYRMICDNFAWIEWWKKIAYLR